MDLNNEFLRKDHSKQKMTMIGGIVLLVLAILLVSVAAVQVFGSKKNAEHLNDVIVRTEGEKTNVPAYADFDGFFQFASYGDDLGYYIAYDEDYFYIMSIAEKDYEYFAKKYDETDGTVRFWGYTEEIPYQAKQYAIEVLNEEMEDENFVSYSNFDDIFGDVMLAADKESNVFGLKSMFNKKGYLVFPGLLAALFGLILFFGGKSALKSYDNLFSSDNYQGQRVLAETNSGTAKWFQDLRVYLTEHYLVGVRSGVSAIAFTDIFWAYITRHRTNGIADYNFLTICTKDGKRVSLGNGRTAGKKHRAQTEEEHSEILNAIYEKNPDVLIGFTKENQAAFADLCKQLKQK